jgi:hypothetical protein
LVEIEGDRKVGVRKKTLKVKTDNVTDTKPQDLSELLAARRAEAGRASSIGGGARILLKVGLWLGVDPFRGQVKHQHGAYDANRRGLRGQN